MAGKIAKYVTVGTNDLNKAKEFLTNYLKYWELEALLLTTEAFFIL